MPQAPKLRTSCGGVKAVSGSEDINDPDITLRMDFATLGRLHDLAMAHGTSVRAIATAMVQANTRRLTASLPQSAPNPAD